jgi:hypothetical protein
VLDRVMATDDLQERRRLILDAQPAILDDLDGLIRWIDRPELENLRTAAREARECYASGYLWACQTLSACNAHDRRPRAPRPPQVRQDAAAFARLDPDEATLREFRAFVVFGAVGKALETITRISHRRTTTTAMARATV